MKLNNLFFLICFLYSITEVGAQPGKSDAIAWIDEHVAALNELNHDIWSFSEIGLEEQRSAEALQNVLSVNGFTIESGVFIFSYPKPFEVILILNVINYSIKI